MNRAAFLFAFALRPRLPSLLAVSTVLQIVLLWGWHVPVVYEAARHALVADAADAGEPARRRLPLLGCRPRASRREIVADDLRGIGDGESVLPVRRRAVFFAPRPLSRARRPQPFGASSLDDQQLAGLLDDGVLRPRLRRGRRDAVHALDERRWAASTADGAGVGRMPSWLPPLRMLVRCVAVLAVAPSSAASSPSGRASTASRRAAATGRASSGRSSSRMRSSVRTHAMLVTCRNSTTANALRRGAGHFQQACAPCHGCPRTAYACRAQHAAAAVGPEAARSDLEGPASCSGSSRTA